MAYKKKFRRKPKKERPMEGLSVKVYHNNVEFALKKLKRKIKKSNLMLELKNRSYFEKPSKIKREKNNLAKLRQRYQTLKDNENN